MNRALQFIIIQVLLVITCSSVSAQDDASIREKLCRVLRSEGAEQKQLLGELSETGSKLVQNVLAAWSRESVYYYEGADGAKVPVLLEEQADADGKVLAVRIDNGAVLTDAKNTELRFTDTDLTAAETDAALRLLLKKSMDTLALSDPDPDARASAVLKLGNSQRLTNIPILEERLTKERNAGVKKTIQESIAMLQLGETNSSIQVAALEQLAQLKTIGCLAMVKRLAEGQSVAPEVAKAAKTTTVRIQGHITSVNFFGTIFRGLSLGSILLIVSLGLAITFGLMGIINMAHGEMIAVGAYTSYVVQNIFGTGFAFSVNLPFSFFGHPLGFGLSLPGLNATGRFYESYFLFVLPLSFLTAALAGLVLERTVIRFLYRRPLESLLATWGVSLVMQQLFRMVFGANNVQVSSPRWLLGHFDINDVSLGYNRVFVIIFAALIVLGTWMLLTKTPLGLMVRAVMQNRDMASCVGVRTARVNMLTFAFGSGLAGLAGAFLSQIGNVGPSLGQSYIVDSFMTVVVGGVGSIVGTVCSAVGIGTGDQILQQITGSPVTGKIVVLICIILFLQWKPGGLFSIRSRNLD
jgi:urea transport system permease protein